jgi:hypothetical protein
MSHIRFNHVFFFLMFVAALCVFVIPARISGVAQGQLQFLFIPVAKPVHALAGWAHDRMAPKTVKDEESPDHPRTPAELIRENDDLRMQVATLTSQLDQLRELNADRERLGPLRERCTPIGVEGFESGLRDSLTLSGSMRDGLKEGMVVLCPDGIVGKLTKVGAGNSRVQLITDKGNRTSVGFARFGKDSHGATVFTSISYPMVVAIGQGKRTMLVKNQPAENVKGVIEADDWAVLDDPEWPRSAWNYRIGRVESIVPQAGAPGFVEIHINSIIDLMLLKEVMVLTK